MALHTTNDPVADQDYQAHVESYRGFLFGIRASVAIAAAVLALLGYFLVA
ncbi:aa3-type cytochrome c oxidase subunit IV [Hyphomicrobium sp.]|nr:aa3-type cytochrome c oxidase subunit IV [Hyphomicrobium sp.]HRN87561.1 aa3-type cytochrome c oxidase subunit IV [Hyphomicrobium sp.]HRQ28335.1 aa3-type cytochrome c oxidase subunit IV [Hyphomicrobium sp.]